MSYTPDSEQINRTELEGIIQGLRSLCKVLTLRFTNKSGWDEEHRLECRALRNKIEELQVELEDL